MANTPTLNFRCPDDLRSYYSDLAERESRSLGSLLVLVLSEWRTLNETGALHYAREALEDLPEGHAFVGATTLPPRPKKRSKR
jgi:hypothetical protein